SRKARAAAMITPTFVVTGRSAEYSTKFGFNSTVLPLTSGGGASCSPRSSASRTNFGSYESQPTSAVGGTPGGGAAWRDCSHDEPRSIRIAAKVETAPAPAKSNLRRVSGTITPTAVKGRMELPRG